MHRFFVPPDHITGETVRFTSQQAHQIGRVLRLRAGEEVVALDNGGAQYVVRLADATRGTILNSGPAPGEPRTRLHLWQGLLKGERWDWVLQKGTEVGIAAFHPLICERSIVRDASESRSRRWASIVQEAAEQSGRGRIPELGPVVSWEEGCRGAAGSGLLLYEGERETRLKEALGDSTTIHLVAGPEGGLTDEEVAVARDYGIPSVTLGPRILRAETAGIIAAALVLYEREG